MFLFLGLNMKPGREYPKTIEKPFHISGLAIDEGENAKLYVTNGKKTFLAATVSKAIPQVPLSLSFSTDDQITFKIKGDARASLLGYWHDNDGKDDKDYTITNLLKDTSKQNKNGKKAGDDDDYDGDEEEEEDDDDRRLIEEYESFLENEEEDDIDDYEDESGEEEESDSDDEEEVAQPKAKVAKLSPETNAKKGAKEQNGVVKKHKESKQPPKTKPEAKKEQPKAKDQTSKQQQPAGGEQGRRGQAGKRVSVFYTG